MSVIPKRRWLEKFTDASGLNEYLFPRLEHEWTPAQSLDVPLMPVIGASYGLNLLGTGVMPKRFGSERVRFLVMHRAGDTVDSQIDDLNWLARRNALGQLWMLDDNGNRRWAKAQVVSMPDWNFGPRNREFVPVSVEFARLSDWYAETQTVVTQTVVVSPTTISVPNVGTADVTAMTIELQSGGTNGYVNPRIDNIITGEWLSVARTGSTSSHRERINTGKYRVERSTDGGATWTDDYAVLTTGATQAGLFTLAPGDNFLEVSQPSGTPNMTVVVRFYAPFE